MFNEFANALARSAIIFVDATPPAADAIAGDALPVRLGTVRSEEVPDPSAMPPENVAGVSKRTKEFLGHLPRKDKAGGMQKGLQ